MFFKRLRIIAVALFLTLFALVACSDQSDENNNTADQNDANVEQQNDEAQNNDTESNNDANNEANDEENDEPELRTEEVFSAIDEHEGKLLMYFFDVEADEKVGDIALIITPDGQTIMTDAGIVKAGPKVDEYLRKLGIDKIDIVMPSHPHHDHIGGFHTILQSREVGEVYQINVPHNTQTYEKLQSLIEQNDIPSGILEEGDVLELGEDVTIEVLNPPAGTSPETLPEGYSDHSASFINNLSLVFKLTYKDHSFLFTGDIYKERERELVDEFGDLLQADFLKVPHHGDDTSSAGYFIDAVQPDIALMPTNILQSFSVYDRYRDRGIDVYVPGLNGTTVVISDGETFEIITEKDSNF